MRFIELRHDDSSELSTMSQMATSIVRGHFDPLILGPEDGSRDGCIFQNVLGYPLKYPRVRLQD